MIGIYYGGIEKENNIGLVRYVLALAVLIAHFNHAFETDIYFPISSYHAVGGFFALSGFLVYRSYEKSKNAWRFIKKRGHKILPPYLVIVLSCAFLLIFTLEPSARADYFSIGWIKYLFANLTFMNFLAPSIPGVFDDVPINGSLWTIKVEWLLYFSVPIFCVAIRKLTKLNPIWLILLIYVISGCYRLVFIELYINTEKEIFNILSRQFFGQLCYFYSGVLFYLIYPALQRHKYWILVGSAVIVAIQAFIPGYEYFFEPLVVAALLLSISFCGRMFNIFNKNNFSYELYLFHFPIFLLIKHRQESLGINNMESLILCLVLITAFSAICWFFLDKRILERNKEQKR